MSLKVLLADESPTIKKAFDIALKDYGIKIQSVHQGIDVKELCEEFKPQICFIDALIPKLNGYEASKQIKSEPSLSKTPTVIMWSGFMELDEEKFADSGANAHIEKPFETKELRALVQQLVPALKSNEIAPHIIPDSIPSDGIFNNSPPDFDEITGSHDLDELDSDFSIENLSAQADPPTIDEPHNKDFSYLDDIDNFKVQTLDDSEAIDNIFGDSNKNQAPPEVDDIFGDLASSTNEASAPDLDDIFSTSSEKSEPPSSLPPTPAHTDLNAKKDHENLDKEDVNAATDAADDDIDSELSLPPLEDDLPIEMVSSKEPEDLVKEQALNNMTPPLPKEVAAAESVAKTNEEVNLFDSDGGNVPKLSKDELKRLILAQSKDIIESVVWDVVPELARELIQKEIARLTGKVEKENLDGDLR